jgi:predicted MPP superfamily phosphohydrolase
MDEIDHIALRERVGDYLYRQRINIEAYHAAQVIGQGRVIFHPENAPFLRKAVTIGLKCLGLYGRARANARAIQIRENHVSLRRLPDSFQGFRLLQLSDLHLDIDPQITDALLDRLAKVEYDLCVITGDYRAETFGDFEPALRETARVVPHLKPPVYAILGNHDALEMAPRLEAMGLRLLLNEHVAIQRGADKIFLPGVDDPHFYETDNLEKALASIPAEATKILLCHTAEPYRQALASGIDLMLCGHTHGGQICLPGGYAPMHNAKHPRWLNRGPWRYHALQGYTTTGVGCSILAVRLFCPPEIVVHVLHREAPAASH